MSTLKFVYDDITNMHVHCIVNSTNNTLSPTGGVCGAIFKAAGYEKLKAACDKIGYCETGQAKITSGYNLYAVDIIHAVSPRYIDGKHNEALLLKQTYHSVFNLVHENHIKSIAFPLLAAGSYGFPVEEAISIGIETCVDFINSGHDIDIYFVTTNDHSYKLGCKMLQDVQLFDMNECLINLDDEFLREQINYFAKHDSVEWISPASNNGYIQLAYPSYPIGMNLPRLIEQLGGYDFNYNQHMKYIHKMSVTDMDPYQIRTFLTYVVRGEKFCDGHIAQYMKNRDLLKACLRLEDLKQNLIQYKKDNEFKKYTSIYVQTLQLNYGRNNVYYDYGLRCWRARIPLHPKQNVYLSVFVYDDTSIMKFSLDIELDHDVHYQFYNEKELRKQIYQQGDEDKYLHEILVRYEPSVLKNIIKPFVTDVFSF